MKKENINSIIGITESFKLPERLMSILFSDDYESVLDKFMELGEPLDHDWFTEYFEEEHANKSKMAQDFTPQGVCRVLSHMMGNAETIADVCAGTGGLTIGMWNNNKNAKYVCYELSERAIPLLLLNLAIRNMDAIVCRCDILTGEEYEYYKLEPSEKYSHITKLEEMPDMKVQVAVSNPPYSLKYDPKKDKRIHEHKDILPTNYADFVFVDFALSIIEENGRIGYVLPSGVLFRANKEQEYRKMLIENDLLKTVIGFPSKLFLNTDIPVVIIELQKDSKSTLIINADREFEKIKAKNELSEENIKKICAAYDLRTDVYMFSTIVNKRKFQENDYNLNIPRYVHYYEPNVIPDWFDTVTQMAELENSIAENDYMLFSMMAKLEGGTPHADKDFRDGLRKYRDVFLSHTAKRKEMWENAEFL